jgi:hypothetical protein
MNAAMATTTTTPILNSLLIFTENNKFECLNIANIYEIDFKSSFKFYMLFWYKVFFGETRRFLQSKSGIFDEKINEVAAKNTHSKMIR